MRIDEALILAAGLSTRLKAQGILTPKFALEVKKAPLIWYPLNSLMRCKVDRFVIVVAEVYLDIAKELVDNYFTDVEVNLVSNKFPNRGNGYSLILGSSYVESEKFYVSMADHVYPPEMPVKMLEDYMKFGEPDILVGGDSKPKFIDVAEATKILADEDGSLMLIGKHIEKFNYIDVGLFIMKNSAIDLIRDLEREADDLNLSKLITKAKSKGLRVQVSDVTGILWTEVDTYEDYISLISGKRREALLNYLENLRC